MKVNCTWDDLYKAAMDKGYGEPELKAILITQIILLLRRWLW